MSPPGRQNMSSTANNNKSPDFSSSPPISDSDFDQRVQECLARNDKMTKKIRSTRAQILFKRDLEMKRLRATIDNMIQKLTRIRETTQHDLDEALKCRQTEFRILEMLCADRSTTLRNLIGEKKKCESDSHSILSKSEIELDETSQTIDSLTIFDLVISPEISDSSRQFLNREKSIYLRTSILSPSDVELILTPSTSTAIDSTRTITFIAVPSRPDPRLHLVLTATLEKVIEGTLEDQRGDRGRFLFGVILAMNDESGAIKITFSPVPSVGEYVVKVCMYGRSVENSPMIIRLTPESVVPQVITASSIKDVLVKRPRKRSLSESALIDFLNDLLQNRLFPNNGNSSPTRSDSPTNNTTATMHALANRARYRSGSPTRNGNQYGNGLAVAPKFRVNVVNAGTVVDSDGEMSTIV